MNHRMFYNQHHKSTYQSKILGIETYTGRLFFFAAILLQDIF